MNAFRTSLLHVIDRSAGYWPEFMADVAASLPAFAHHVVLRYMPDQPWMDRFLKTSGVVQVYYAPASIPAVTQSIGADAVLWYGRDPRRADMLPDVGHARVVSPGEEYQADPSWHHIELQPYVDTNRVLVDCTKSRQAHTARKTITYGLFFGRDEIDPELTVLICRTLDPDRHGLLVQGTLEKVPEDLKRALLPFKRANALTMAAYAPGALARHCGACNTVCSAGDQRTTMTLVASGVAMIPPQDLIHRRRPCPHTIKRDTRVALRPWDSRAQAGLFQYEIYHTIKCTPHTH